MLVDEAMTLTGSLWASPAARIGARPAAGHDVYSAHGWTGIHNMSVDWADVEAIEALGGLGRAAGPARLQFGNAGGRRAPAASRARATRPTVRAVTRARSSSYVDGALGVRRGAALFEALQ
jgi:hypothetical protein